MPRVAKFGGNVRFYESTRTPLEVFYTQPARKGRNSANVGAQKRSANYENPHLRNRLRRQSR